MLEDKTTMEEGTESVGFLQVIRNRNFFAIWLAQIVSNFGDWLALLALLSYAGLGLRVGADELGRLAAVFLLPQALAVPMAGALVDRMDLKKTMIVSDLVLAVLVALLVFTNKPIQIYPIVLLASVAVCFFSLAQFATVARVVRKPELLVANSLTTQVIYLSGIVAPALAGTIIARIGEKSCFIIDSLTFLFSAICVSTVRFPASQREGELIESSSARPGDTGLAEPASSRWRWRTIATDLGAGLRFAVQNRLVTFAVGVAAVSIFIFGSVNTLGVIYIRDVLLAGPETLGILLSSAGAGAIIGVFLIGKFAQKVPRVRTMTVGVFTLGLGILWLTMISHRPGAFVGAFVIGLAAAAVIIPSQTLIQEQTPQGMLGRMGGASSSLITISQTVSITIAGAAASWIGIKGVYRIAGLILFLVPILGLLYLRGWPRRRSEPESISLVK